MLPVNDAYMEALQGERKMYAKVEITLLSEETITLEDDQLMDVVIEDSTSSEKSFDVGSVIINKATIEVNNEEGFYDQYDFTKARVIPHCGLETTSGTQWLQKGVFTVDDAKTSGAVIVLTCLDNMHKLDWPYDSSEISYPTTSLQVIQDMCRIRQVTLGTTRFDNDGFVIEKKPETGGALTFRMMLSYVAQISGCYARMNNQGELELKWYDAYINMKNADGGIFDVFDPQIYKTGDAYDGGNFIDYTKGDILDSRTFEDSVGYHHLQELSRLEVSTTDVTITGLRMLGSERVTRNYFGRNNARIWSDGMGTSVRPYLNKSLAGMALDHLEFTLYEGTQLPLPDGVSYAYQYCIGLDVYDLNFPGEYVLSFDSKGLDIEAFQDRESALYVFARALVDDGASVEKKNVKLVVDIHEHDPEPTFTMKSRDFFGSDHHEVGFEFKSYTGPGQLVPDQKGNIKFDIWFNLILDFLGNQDGQKVSIDNFSIKRADGGENLKIATYGTTNYALNVENNPLIIPSNAQAVVDFVGAKIDGMRFRPLSGETLGEPHVEAGDVAIVSDAFMKSYPTVLTNLRFSMSDAMSFSCGAETITENQTTRYSVDATTGVVIGQDTKALIENYDIQILRMLELMLSAIGLHRTVQKSGGKAIYYVHDKRNLSESTFIWRSTPMEFSVSVDGGASYAPLLKEDGSVEKNALSIIGLKQDWIS